MPVSVIEAMALGLPVVSTNVGGIPYLIDDKVDGILINDNAVSEMVNAINSLFNNNQFTEKCIANARIKATGFDWEIVKNQWIIMLNNLK